MSRPKRKPLLEEDVEEVAQTLTVNRDYAARLEHNKKREELHRLKEKHPDAAARIEAQRSGRPLAEQESSSDPESSSDEEDSQVLNPEADTHFLTALAKIRKRDAAIYSEGAALFPDNVDAPHDVQKPAEKPVYLRQVIAEQALAGGAGSSDDEGAPARPPTYAQEQEELRRAFLQEANSVNDAEGEAVFGGVLQKRSSSKDEGEPGVAKSQGQEISRLLDEYFGEDEQLDESDRFLKAYIGHRGWAAGEDERIGGMSDDDVDLDEEEEHLENADRFEALYNMRHEEPGSSHIATYPREVEGLIRKTDPRRRLVRERRAARQAEREEQQRAEVRRLKNLKREEIDKRLSSISRVAGAAGPDAALLDTLFAGDFDPEEYDRAMSQAFDDSYYEVKESKADIMGNDIDELEDLMDEQPAREGFEAVHARLQQQGLATTTAGTSGDEYNYSVDMSGKSKTDVAAEKVQAMLEEYYKLDYEDKVAGIKCRFPYIQVPQTNYGLSVEDMLSLTEKELNQVVGLRRLAPYREDGGVARPNYGVLNQLRRQQREQSAAETAITKHHKHKKAKRKRYSEAQGPRAAQLSAEVGKIAKHTPARQRKLDGKRSLQTEGTADASTHEQHAIIQPQYISDEAQKSENRAQSYQKLSLKHKATISKPKNTARVSSAGTQQQQWPVPQVRLDGKPMSKALKKNLKRSMKRAARASIVA